MSERHGGLGSLTPYLPAKAPWSEISPESASALLSSATIHAAWRGDVLGHGLGIVLSGAIAAEREFSDGRRVFASLYRRGDFIDMRGDARRDQGDLIALRPTHFLVLDPSATDINLSRFADLADAVLTQLREQAERAREHATDLAGKTPVERIANLLFEFRRWSPSPADAEHEDGETIQIPIQRRDIAAYIGVKPETLSRAMKRLERDKLISVGDAGTVDLLDVASMRKIADGGYPRRSN